MVKYLAQGHIVRFVTESVWGFVPATLQLLTKLLGYLLLKAVLV